MTETTTVKTCVACGKSLNGQKRMKDSQGRYWCLDCGTEDQRKKLVASGGGNQCSACGDTFPGHQLSKFGNRRLCPGCARARTQGPGLKQKLTDLLGQLGGGQADTGKLYKLLAIMGLLILLAIWRFATL
jgi:hypothetical protein